MKDGIIYVKSLAFGVRCIKLFHYLKGKAPFSVSDQMLRSGSSIGANVRESRFAQSPADFISKITIALKEAEETQYWLELLFQANIINETEFKSMYSDADELIALLVSTLKTYKKNMNY
jgi:four helix bundle protein